MKLAVIQPPGFLGTLDDDTYDYHLVLNSQLQASDEYFDYYVGKLTRGDRVILDNDAWETGQGVAIDEFIETIDSFMQAADSPEQTNLVVIIPDVLRDATATAELSLQCYPKLRQAFGSTVEYLVVPQGRSLHDWTQCLHWFSTMRIGAVPFNWLGITRCNQAFPGGIPFCVKYAAATVPGAPIHILGLGQPVAQYERIGDLEPVQGLDTCKPTVYARAQTYMDKAWWPEDALTYLHRPDDFWSWVASDEDQEWLPENARELRAYLTSTLPQEEFSADAVKGNR